MQPSIKTKGSKFCVCSIAANILSKLCHKVETVLSFKMWHTQHNLTSFDINENMV